MTFAKYPVTGGGGGGGSGDVVGPASSVNNGIVLFDGVSGKLVKDAGVGSANQVLVTNGTTPGFSLIANANINASANIALSKLAALTASRALVSDGSGIISASAVTATEVGYLSGVTSAIQTQINSVSSSVSGRVLKAGDTMTGNLIFDALATSAIETQFTGSATSPRLGMRMSKTGGTPQEWFAGMNSVGETNNAWFLVNVTGTTKLIEARANNTVTCGGSWYFTGAIGFMGGTAANLSIWAASNVLRQRGGSSGWAVDNTSGNAIISATDAGAVTLGTTSANVKHILQSASTSGVAQIWGYGTGGAYLQITEDAVQDWFVGMDNGSSVLKIRPTSLATASILEATTAGAWTMGPSGSRSFIGNNSTITGIYRNCYITSGDRGNRSSTTESGAAIECIAGATTPEINFYMNADNDGLTASAYTAGACVAGAWTLGPASGFAGVSNHRFNGSIKVLGNIPGTAYEANTLLVDKNGGITRFFSCGPDVSTSGTYEFYTSRSDSSSNTQTIGITGAGAVTLGPTSGTTNTTHYFNNRSTTLADAAVAINKGANNTTTSNVLVWFAINNSTGSGQINANGASAAAFGTFSDARLKENIENLPPQLDNILALRPVEFDYKTGGHQIGFIAQEMETVYPDAVNIVGETDETKTITGWDKTSARLVKAIQELKAELDAAKSRISELEAN